MKTTHWLSGSTSVGAIIAIVLVAVSGCTHTNTPQSSPGRLEQGVQTIQRTPEMPLTKIAIRPQGPVITVVRKYLAAAGKQDTAASKTFLSINCKDDIVIECQANANSGWTYSEPDTRIESEIVNADGLSASVKAQVVYKGGRSPTFMGQSRTFTLVLENGEWKISGVDPAPRKTGPGVSPIYSVEPDRKQLSNATDSTIKEEPADNVGQQAFNLQLPAGVLA